MVKAVWNGKTLNKLDKEAVWREVEGGGQTFPKWGENYKQALNAGWTTL